MARGWTKRWRNPEESSINYGISKSTSKYQWHAWSFSETWCLSEDWAFPGLVQYSLGPDFAGGGRGGGRGEKKKRQRPKKLANEASRLERGPFTLPNLPLWLASLSDFSAISLRFSPFPPLRSLVPGWVGGASIVQVSSLTWWSLRVHPGRSRIYNFPIKRLGCLFGPEAFIRVWRLTMSGLHLLHRCFIAEILYAKRNESGS